jgi:glycosyltransferase involved in cell wall biosynthesis
LPLTVLNVAQPLASVGPDEPGEAEQIITRLDEALVRTGHTSLVLACGGPTFGKLLPAYNPAREYNDNARRAVWERHRHMVHYALRNWAVDVVHMHGRDFHAYMPPEGVPVIVTMHFAPARYPPAVFKCERPETYLQCVSESERRSVPHFLNGGALLPTIENGVPVRELFEPHAKRNFVLAVGRISREKGFHIALDAAGRAGVPLLIAGKVCSHWADRNYFDEEIAPRLNHRRRLIGRIGFQRKRRLLSKARCLLVPSLEPEMSSLVAMEAMACGTPVVAFPKGDLPEIIEHGRTGFLVHDADEMADAIHAAGELDPELCRSVARRRFSAERMTAEYLVLYERLAHRHARAETFRQAA